MEKKHTTKELIIKAVVNIVALFIVVEIVGGIQSESITATFAAGIVLTLVNIYLKPAIIMLTLPFNILSLGFLTLIINGALFYAIGAFIKDFHISNFSSAFWGALLFSIVSILLNLFIKPSKNIHIRTYRGADPSPPEIPDNIKYKDIIDVEALPDDDKKDS